MTQPEVDARYREWSRQMDGVFADQETHGELHWGLVRRAKAAWVRYDEARREMLEGTNKEPIR